MKMSAQGEKVKKIVIVGVDGATWDLLKPWADKGNLPKIKKLMQEGVYGDLSSSIPSSTVPAWVDFATGRNPGSHGCYNFMVPQNSLLEASPVNRENISGDTFYEILEKHGKKSIIINLPASFPPKTKKAIFLPSFLTLGEKETYPKNLVEQIPEIRDYRVIPSPVAWTKKGNILVKAARDLASVRFKIAKKLFLRYKWDFFFVLFSATDWIQHRKYRSPSVLTLYKDLDNYLGWFIDNLSEDTVLIVISDHGFGETKYRFHINEWLQEKGLLRIKKAFLKRGANLPLGPMQIMGDEGQGTGSLLLKNILRLVFNNQPLYFLSGEAARFLNKAAPWLYSFLPYGLSNAGLELDMKNTFACSISGTYSGIYINDKKRFKDGKVENSDYEHLREEIIHGLRRLRDAQGNRVFKEVYKKEEVYRGESFTFAPDILFEEKDTFVTISDLGGVSLFDKTTEEGSHRRNGIFLAYGKQIKKNTRIIGADLKDLAPTVLKLFYVSIPDDMEGRVLSRIFKGQTPSDLEKKVSKSKKIIQEAFSMYKPEEMAIAWTGGKDSNLLLWLIREVSRKHKTPRAVFIDEGDVFEEVNRFAKDFAKKMKLRVEFFRNEDVLRQVKRLGDRVLVSKLNSRNKKELQKLKFRGKSFSFEPESFIGNHLMKTVPLNLYLEKRRIRALFTGIRRDEHEARAKEKYFSPRKKPPHTRVHPLLHFKEADVWKLTHSLSIPYNLLYEEGYRSLGAKSSTEKISNEAAWRQGQRRAKERAGRRQDKERIMQRLRTLGYM